MHTDHDSFTAQAMPCRQFLLCHAYRLTHNIHDADDLVQETLLRGWRKFHQFQPGTNLKAWLARILSNLFLNTCRSSRRRVKAASLDELGPVVASTPQPSHQPDCEDSRNLLDERSFVENLDAGLVEALRELPSEYRDVLLMTAFETAGYKSMARKLNVPLGTINSRLHRARSALRDTLVAVEDS